MCHLWVAALPKDTPAVSSTARDQWPVYSVCGALLGKRALSWPLIYDGTCAGGLRLDWRAWLPLTGRRGRKTLLVVFCFGHNVVYVAFYAALHKDTVQVSKPDAGRAQQFTAGLLAEYQGWEDLLAV